MKSTYAILAILITISLLSMGAATRRGARRPTSGPAVDPNTTVVGMISEITPDKAKPGAFTLTLAVRAGRQTESRTVAGDSSTQIVIAGQPAKFEDLKIGYRVTVKPPTGPAKSIEVAAGRQR